MRDGNVPRFFLCGRADPAGGAARGQLSEVQLSSSQLFQLFMILLAWKGRGERLEERRGRGEEGGRKGGWKKMENYLLNK